MRREGLTALWLGYLGVIAVCLILGRSPPQPWPVLTVPVLDSLPVVGVVAAVLTIWVVLAWVRSR